MAAVGCGMIVGFLHAPRLRRGGSARWAAACWIGGNLALRASAAVADVTPLLVSASWKFCRNAS